MESKLEMKVQVNVQAKVHVKWKMQTYKNTKPFNKKIVCFDCSIGAMSYVFSCKYLLLLQLCRCSARVMGAGLGPNAVMSGLPSDSLMEGGMIQ